MIVPTNGEVLAAFVLLAVVVWIAAKVIAWNHKAWREHFIGGKNSGIVHIDDWGKK